MSREQERRKQLARLPAPRLAAPGYEAVGYWLLQARAKPGTASEYNKALGELCAACTSARTLPAPKQFAQSMGTTRQKLDTAYRQATNQPARRDLKHATWTLKRAEEEAAAVGLLP